MSSRSPQRGSLDVQDRTTGFDWAQTVNLDTCSALVPYALTLAA